MLLFLQWSRGNTRVRWRALGGFGGAETKPWACYGEGPGNARLGSKSPARVVGRAGAFGSWLSAFGFRLSARMGAGFAAAGWRRFSGKPLASGPCPVRNRPRRARSHCRTRAPETARFRSCFDSSEAPETVRWRRFQGGFFCSCFCSETGAMHAPAGGLWAGLREQKPSLGPFAGKAPETPGQAAKVRPAWLGGPGISDFGFQRG